MPFIAPIVEGHGEVEALPILLRRMFEHAGSKGVLQINAPIRVKAGSFLRDSTYFSKHVSLAANKAAQKHGSVLILLDCDDGCPAEAGPPLLARAMNVRSDISYLVVLAHREFESWFIAAAESLSGTCGLLLPDLDRPPTGEGIRDAKGWLGKQMRGGYDPITHQHKFARIFDLDQAKSNPSFARFCERLPRLLEQSDYQPPVSSQRST